MSLVKRIPRYFFCFDAIINGFVCLIYFSGSSLLIYRNATDFCLLVLYPAPLLNFFISSNRFFCCLFVLWSHSNPFIYWPPGYSSISPDMFLSEVFAHAIPSVWNALLQNICKSCYFISFRYLPKCHL